MMKLTRRKFLSWMTVSLGASTIAPTAAALEPIIPIRGKKTRQFGRDPIPVGILHSLSGTMALTEKSLVDVAMLAIEEINRSGGVLGRKIAPRVEDGASNWSVFREKAELLVQNQVATIFGGFTSASRKMMLPFLESEGQLLWYPAMYEGQECSQNIFYTGLLPNQMIEPVVNWLVKTYPKKPFYLVASDFMFPRVFNQVLKSVLERRRIQVVGEVYIPLGEIETPSQIMGEIRRKAPGGAIIFNVMNGDSNIPFYRDRFRSGVGAMYPVIAPFVSEEDVVALSLDYMKETLTIASYFQTVDNPMSRKFVDAVKTTYGKDRLVTDAMAAAYTSVYLWKLAVEKAGTAADLNRVEKAARGLVWDAPMGRVTMQQNHHLSLPVRVGKVRSDGLFDIVFESAGTIAPEPWNQDLLETKGYACDWSNPELGEKYRRS